MPSSVYICACISCRKRQSILRARLDPIKENEHWHVVRNPRPSEEPRNPNRTEMRYSDDKGRAFSKDDTGWYNGNRLRRSGRGKQPKHRSSRQGNRRESKCWYRQAAKPPSPPIRRKGSRSVGGTRHGRPATVIGEGLRPRETDRHDVLEIIGCRKNCPDFGAGSASTEIPSPAVYNARCSQHSKGPSCCTGYGTHPGLGGRAH